MKRIFISIVAAFLCALSYGENTVSMEPLSLTTAQAVTGQTGTINFHWSTEGNTMTGISGRVFLPKGFMQTTGCTAADFDASAGCSWKSTKYYGNLLLMANADLGETEGDFTVKYKVVADMAAGVYPVYISTVSLLGDGNDTSDDYTLSNVLVSYIVVGDGGDGALTFPQASSEIPSTVMEYLNTDEQITSLDLSNVVAVNGTYGIVDGRSVTAPSGLTVDKMSYYRAAHATNSYGTVNLPWASTGSYYTWDGTTRESDNSAHMVAASSLAANTTAMIDASAAFQATSVDGTYTIASYDPTDKETINEADATGMYYLKNDCLYKVNGYVTASQYRGLLDYGTSDVKGYYFDDETGISGITVDNQEGVYDLNGRKLNKTTRGINIVNGQKILKK